MRCIIVAFAFAGMLFAQNARLDVPRSDFPLALRLFLDLSEEQVRMVKDLNEGYSHFAIEKARRIDQVQWEIA